MFNFEEIFSLPVTVVMTVLEVKQLICRKYNTVMLKEGEQEWDPEHIRLREKTIERLGKVLHNADLMKDHSVIDNK